MTNKWIFVSAPQGERAHKCELGASGGGGSA